MSGERERILLVDDDPDFTELVASYLDAQGFEVMTRTGVAEALACLEGVPRIRLVVTDLLLARSTGTELCRTVRNRWPEVAVMVLSGDEQGFEQALAAGASRCFLKPLRLDAMTEAIRAALSQGQTEQAQSSN